LHPPIYDPEMSETPAPEPSIPPPPPQQTDLAATPMPPPPPASFAPSGAVAVADSGPVGKPRSIGLIILLTIVTLGIWMLVWSYQNGEELKKHARTGIGGIGYLFITLLLSPVTMFLMAGEVEQLYRREGQEPPITTIWGLWFLLPLIGPIIWYVRIQRSLNEYWVAHGAIA
jgi:Domain of unknown function (DUF4234)